MQNFILTGCNSNFTLPLFAEATGAISQVYAFCKYVVQPL